jgi:glycosyltransferase involved in cell wall biosynthesis
MGALTKEGQMNRKKNQSVDVSLIIPCFNEEPVFVESCRHISRVFEGSRFSYEIIFVDDKSTDRTVQLIQNIVKNDTHYHAIFHEKNMGRGQAVMDGIHMACGTIVGYIDVDLEVSPAYIPDIVSMMKEQEHSIDMVIGQRIYRSTLKSAIREILSNGYRWMIRHLLPTDGVDTESGYKFFRRAKILPIIAECRDRQWFWDTEIVVRSRMHGLHITQYPVLFLRRFDKVSSVNIIRDTIGYVRAIQKFQKTVSA